MAASMEPESQTVRLLRRINAGDEAAAEELLPLVYGELRGLAGRLMASERKEHTLQPTALLHEAWLRLNGADAKYENRLHFLRIAARAMRRVLVDHARRKGAEKRGGDREAVPLDDALALYENDPVDLLALDEALQRLEENDAGLARIVELRYFAGLTLEEAGEALGQSPRQVHRGWTFARGWLRRELEDIDE